jgi:TonB family protein
MSCSRIRTRLSSYLDGEMRALERLEVETHLHACGPCRRRLHQFERAIGMIRQLRPLDPPRFSLHRARTSPRAARPVRWERIRAGRLAPLQPSLRPLAFAALALLLVLALFRVVNRGEEIPVDLAPAAPGAVRIPAAGPEAGPGDRPEWLQREIAARVLQAQRQQDSGGAAAPPSADPGPASIAEAPVGIAPGAAAGEGPADEGRRAGPEPGAAPSVPPVVVAGAEDGGAGSPEPASQGETTVAAAGTGGGEIAAGRPPAASLVVIGAPREAAAGRPAPSPTAATPKPQPRPARLSLSTSPSSGAAPPAEVAPAAEIGLTQRVVAVMAPDATGISLTFVEPVASGAALAPAAEGMAVERAEPADDLPPADPDPETGVTPPRPLDRPGVDLARAASDLRQGVPPSPLAASVTISAEGTVDDVSVLSGTGIGWLDDALVEAIRRWSFQPAALDGEPLRSVQEIVVEFDLD